MRILKTQRSRGGGRRNSKKLGNRRTYVSSRGRILRNCCGNGGEKFSEKLQALKSLLPPSTTTEKTTEQNVHVEEESLDGGETEQLFQETADYIVRLRNQVLVLQKLIKIYGSSDEARDFVL
ncbi:hypothetical protein EUTSA_v10027993mg [Eutrema salsugineum]|uniref:BHLH domain-containing protein n=2 Tax=Eutrema salsugineum TaxID=72664 RepID=V4NL40_EUTSA|nr:hypothetical protein EUTSA_v10027993mg [Eutrema salsugineum]